MVLRGKTCILPWIMGDIICRAPPLEVPLDSMTELLSFFRACLLLLLLFFTILLPGACPVQRIWNSNRKETKHNKLLYLAICPEQAPSSPARSSLPSPLIWAPAQKLLLSAARQVDASPMRHTKHDVMPCSTAPLLTPHLVAPHCEIAES